MSQFESTWKRYSSRVERVLAEELHKQVSPSARLGDAVAYTILGGGKRFRAMLVYASGEMLGASPEFLDPVACAVEMVHAYSLAHDDLPAMDDDVLRRGRPSCHIEFDEATAILTGDVLQSFAMEILASEKFNPADSSTRARMVEVLAHAIGLQGMAGGQALDMESMGKRPAYHELAGMHALKTGALIEASVMLGGIAALGPRHELLQQLSDYGKTVGLIFQIADDILDYTSDSQTLGKETGADSRMNKATYVSIMGIDEARQEAQRLSCEAIEKLRGLGEKSRFLIELVKFVVNRKF